MFFYRCSMNTASTLFSILLTCLYILVIIADLSFLASQRCDWRKGDCLRDESVMNVMCERNCSRTLPGCLFRVDRFGIGLKYQCHCFDIGDCDFDNDGYCNGTKCFFGHSGPTCQRRLYYESFETAVKNYESFLGQRKVWRPRNEHLRTRRATCQSLPKKTDFPHVFRINWVKFNIFPAVTIPVYITSSMGNQPLSCTFNPNSPNRVDESSYTAVSCTGDINTNWLHINGSNACIDNLQMSGCPQELFGLDCTYKCRCKNGTTCHQITGHCTEGCEPGRVGSSCQYQTYENIALGRPAFQSSDFEVKFLDGDNLCSSKYLATASFAVDGKYNQNFQHKSCSRTKEKPSKSYWYVKLDRNYTINQIRIYTHSFFRYSLNVFVGDKNDPCSQLCYKSKSTESILYISCQRPLVGESVCIQTAKKYASLSLCEVEVIRWINSFVLDLIYTMNPYSTSDSPAENISRALEHEFLTMTGEFKIEYCGSEKGRTIFSIRCTVLRKITKDQVRRNIYKILKTSQTLHNFGIQKNNTELIGEMHCNENTTSTNNHTFFWPMTKVGTTAEITCGTNVATRLCSSTTAVLLEMPTSQTMTSPQCSPFTGIWEEPDISRCYNTEWITRQLKDIKSQDIDKQNIDTISKELLDFSQKSIYFKEEDINLAIDIHEEMMPLISNVSTNITVNNILLSINNMINTPEEILVVAEQANKSVNRMLNVIETIAETILLKEQQLTVLYDNLGAGVAKVEKVFNGLFYGVLFETNETEAKSVVYNSSYSDLQLEDISLMNYISLPNNILNHLKAEERSSVSRVSFSSMRDDKLYTVIQKSRNERISKINSHIIASKFPNIQITKLDEPVTISFNLKYKNATNPQCVYWDETPGQDPHWSTKGCNAHKYVPGEKVLCFCNHLTSFALLMDVYQNEGNVKNTQLLSIISNVGCGISFVFLILTVIVHVYFKKLWKLMASKILVNLCISLAVTNLIFLIGMQVYIAKITAVCKAVAALLHYFLLTTVMWMTVEAVHVCLSVIVVFKAYKEYILMRSSICAWCLPAGIVVLTLATNHTNNYIRIAQVCWLSKTSFYAAFLSPVSIFLIINLSIFFLIIWRLILMKNKKEFEHKARKVRVFGIIGLFFLFGICLTLAFFAFGGAAEMFKFLFVIFNTLQGSFIFMFYCVYKKDTRDVIRKYIYERKRMNLWNVTTSRGPSSANETNKTGDTKF